MRSAARFFFGFGLCEWMGRCPLGSRAVTPAKVLSKLGCRCPLSLSAASRLALVGRWSLA